MKLASGQVAAITGAASGIGFALAVAFAARGLRLVLVDADADRLDAAARMLAGRSEILSLLCDVRDPGAVEVARDRALGRFGRVDILCNNAGGNFARFGPVWQTGPEEWRRTLAVNLDGVFNGIRAFAPAMIAREAGHIVNTASMAGMSVVPLAGAYAAAKHAIVSLSETLAADLRQTGSAVGVSVLCCGSVRTRPAHEAQARPEAVAAAVSARHIAPAAAAAAVLDAIEDERLYVFTHEDSEARLRRRLAPIFADLPLPAGGSGAQRANSDGRK